LTRAAAFDPDHADGAVRRGRCGDRQARILRSPVPPHVDVLPSMARTAASGGQDMTVR
jgi:hypothetical protein